MALPPSIDALSNLWTETHYELIGKVAANWAALELLVGSALWKLAQVHDHEGACLTAQIPNMARRLESLVALAKVRGVSSKLMKKVDKFGGDTHGLQAQRNRVVHDPWHIDQNTGAIQRLEISTKGGLKFGYVPMSLDDLRHLVDLIHNHINRFDDLAREIFAELEPSPEKPEQ